MSGLLNAPRGIPRDRPPQAPIGAAISIGRKGPNGAPIDKWRFFIVRPVADARGKEGRRDAHPAFTAFNALSCDAGKRDNDRTPEGRAHDELRATVRGILVHGTPEEAWTENFVGDKLPGHMHPKGHPSCIGNGVDAVRWMPGRNDYMPILCPGARCEFQRPGPPNPRTGRPDKPPCHDHAKLIFQLRMKVASPLCKFTTNGKESSSSIAGFFAHIREQAATLGVREPSFYGLPFALTLASRTGEGSRYSVCHMTPDFSDGLTLQEYLLSQGEGRRKLQSEIALLQIGTAATIVDDRENDGEDLRSISRDGVPTIGSVP